MQAVVFAVATGGLTVAPEFVPGHVLHQCLQSHGSGHCQWLNDSREHMKATSSPEDWRGATLASAAPHVQGLRATLLYYRA